jgi:hypothetical protein
MANKTSWVGGNLYAGLGWTSVFGTEINSLGSNSTVSNSVMSSVPVLNANSTGGGLDQFMDISVVCNLSGSSAVPAGASFGIWLAMLNEDGVTYGDGLSNTTQQNIVPPYPPIAAIPLYASTRTAVIGNQSGILMPPGNFCLIIQNNTQFNLAASNNTVSIRTYNQNLND